MYKTCLVFYSSSKPETRQKSRYMNLISLFCCFLTYGLYFPQLYHLTFSLHSPPPISHCTFFLYFLSLVTYSTFKICFNSLFFILICFSTFNLYFLKPFSLSILSLCFLFSVSLLSLYSLVSITTLSLHSQLSNSFISPLFLFSCLTFFSGQLLFILVHVKV